MNDDIAKEEYVVLEVLQVVEQVSVKTYTFISMRSPESTSVRDFRLVFLSGKPSKELTRMV